jgi:hypothetical protein
MHTQRFITRGFALSLGLFGLGSIAEGQEQLDSVKVEWVKPRWSNGSLGVRVGTAHLGLGALNENFARNGRPQFASNVATIGFAGHARFGRLMLGAGGESALANRIASTDWISKISFGSATLETGVALIDGRGFLVAPQFSIGVRKTSLRMDRPGDFTYDQGVKDPARGVAFSTREGLVGVGVIAERHLRVRANQFSLGVQAGIAQPFGGPATFAGESHVHGTPRQDTGRYLRLIFGKPIGGRRDAMTAVSGALLSMIGG